MSGRPSRRPSGRRASPRPSRPRAGRGREALLGLGSNLAPERNLADALTRIAEVAPVLGVSRAWRTPPVGVGGGEFLNAAAIVAAPRGGLEALRAALRRIEVAMGRPAGHDPAAARPIDLDVLAVRWPGGDWLAVEPGLAEQPWQLLPAVELAPGLRLPGGVPASRALARRPLPGARLYEKSIFQLPPGVLAGAPARGL